MGVRSEREVSVREGMESVARARSVRRNSVDQCKQHMNGS